MKTKWWKTYRLEDVVGSAYPNLEKLGNGLNGVVFRAYSQARQGFVAIKFVRITENDRIGRKRMKAEIAAMERLDGKFAVQIYESNTTVAPPYIVMEYHPLGDLRKKLNAKIRTLTALRLFLEVCSCVKYCHDNEVTHRDIKPENILFKNRTRLVLSDFGLCKIDDEYLGTRAEEMQQKGTPFYMAPEQQREFLIQSKPADIYALGIVLHYDIRDKIKNPKLKDDIEELSEKCTIKLPSRRLDINSLIEKIQTIIDKANLYSDNRRKIQHIVRITNELINRVRSGNGILIGIEGACLLQYLKQFNAIDRDYFSYHTSDNWHLDEEYPYYSSGGMSMYYTNYLRHEKGEISDAEQTQLVLKEASLFKRFIKSCLKEL